VIASAPIPISGMDQPAASPRVVCVSAPSPASTGWKTASVGGRSSRLAAERSRPSIDSGPGGTGGGPRIRPGPAHHTGRQPITCWRANHCLAAVWDVFASAMNAGSGRLTRPANCPDAGRSLLAEGPRGPAASIRSPPLLREPNGGAAGYDAALAQALPWPPPILRSDSCWGGR